MSAFAIPSMTRPLCHWDFLHPSPSSDNLQSVVVSPEDCRQKPRNSKGFAQGAPLHRQPNQDLPDAAFSAPTGERLHQVGPARCCPPVAGLRRQWTLPAVSLRWRHERD